MKKRTIIWLAAFALLINQSCTDLSEQPKVKVYTQRDTTTVLSKRIEHIESNFWGKGHDKYMIAFRNGKDIRTTYSKWECAGVGDTAIYHKLNTEYFWNLEFNCK